MSNIAVFGGTFNPFHIGHYEMLETLCDLDFVDKVYVMPDHIPPHKSFDNVVSDNDRKNMCAIACNDFNKAELCLVEFERDGKSYTIDTVRLLKEKYPTDKFYIVIGGDMLSSLDTWYNWQDLIKETSFLAFSRKGQDDFESSLKRLTSLGADIKVIDKKITEVSSTMLRKNINKRLLPHKIYEYIIQKGIYNV